MSIIRYGIIGCGIIHETHLKAIAALPECAKLVAVCDNNPEALRKTVEKTGVKGYASAAELVADPDIDVITVCTPSGLHADHAIMALNAGKHAISEKPMDIDLSKADEMIAASKRNNRLLAVISQTRYGDGAQQLHKWIDAGKFGRLIHGNARLFYYRSQEYYDSAGWRGTWAMDGGGALMNQGVHYVDQLIWAMGLPKTVYALAGCLGHERVEVEDTVSATIEFESGAIGSLTATTCAYPNRGGLLDVLGATGSAQIRDAKLVYADFADGTRFDPTADQGTAALDPRLGGFVEHYTQLRDITQAIVDGRQPEITMQDGRNALQLVLAVYESARTGRVVTL
ncbi:MAG: Gfo/Idh/MocA family oxidoreductase [Capsulimonadaceae bacterium]|nr:Gfo/Idh/MocA family oxidoreductase [Capsulimonadaceae bacterium]